MSPANNSMRVTFDRQVQCEPEFGDGLTTSLGPALGKALRAVAQDRETAGLMGINPNHLIMLTIVISSALAGMEVVLLDSTQAQADKGKAYSANLIAKDIEKALAA